MYVTSLVHDYKYIIENFMVLQNLSTQSFNFHFRLTQFSDGLKFSLRQPNRLIISPVQPTQREKNQSTQNTRHF